MNRKLYSLTLLLFLVLGKTAAQDLSEKATHFLNSLSAELRAKAQFPLEDPERYNMNYVPIPRKGPTFNDFNDVQAAAAIDLLRASLSAEGFHKTEEIRSLEKVLRIIENNDNDKMPDGRPRRDPMNYHISIFGDPTSSTPWGWRFEGHHLSLNFTSNGNEISSATPTFFGTNPGIVRSTEYKGKEVLRQEAVLGFALVNSMTEDQLTTVLYSKDAPGDILSLTAKKTGTFEPNGISYSQLTATQREIFDALLETYLDNYEMRFATDFRDKIKKAGIENLHFAWAGSLSPGAGHYYRIQGPMLLIEYDNTQNNANHVHEVVRDLTNDYGADVLAKHYQEDHN